jgi:hypothetical protein
MQRAGSGIFQDSNDGEIGSDADEVASYLDQGSSQGKPLSHRFMGGEAISALTGLHCKTKLHSTEADSVPILHCKRNVVSVRERPSRERHPTVKTSLTTRTKNGS